MIVAKYGNYVRKFMWQLCEWGRVDICITFHKRAFDFFISITKAVSILTGRDTDFRKWSVEWPTNV
jgi:hypothetical protein